MLGCLPTLWVASCHLNPYTCNVFLATSLLFHRIRKQQLTGCDVDDFYWTIKGNLLSLTDNSETLTSLNLIVHLRFLRTKKARFVVSFDALVNHHGCLALASIRYYLGEAIAITIMTKWYITGIYSMTSNSRQQKNTHRQDKVCLDVIEFPISRFTVKLQLFPFQ